MELAGSMPKAGSVMNRPKTVCVNDLDWFCSKTGQTGWFRSGSDNTDPDVSLALHLFCFCTRVMTIEFRI
jgi:hypothetical protein